MSAASILIVEDSPVVLATMKSVLETTYQVATATKGEEALRMAETQRFDLILVDLGLPDMDGNKLWLRMRTLPAQKHAAMVVVSGRSDIEDKLMSFSMGATDYLVKPVDPRELRARISSVLKRQSEAVSQTSIFRKGPFTLHFATLSAHAEHLGKPVEITLSPQEFKALHYVLTHVGHVLSRRQILDHVWGQSRFVQERSVDALLSKLRRKLYKFGGNLEAVHGMGYRFLLDEKVTSAAEPSQMIAPATGSSALGVSDEIVQVFIREAQETLVSLRESIVNRDVGQMRALAHRWKSGCRLVGLESMGALCLSLEKADLSEGAEAWEDAKKVLMILESQLHRFTQRRNMSLQKAG